MLFPICALSSLRLAPSRSLAASVPSCPAGRALVPGPGPAARCRRSEQLSSACSGFGTRCYESEASRAPRPAGGVGCAAGPETGISPQLASPSGDSLALSVALLCLGGAGRVREEPSLSCACGISADMTAWGKFESLLLALLALCAGLLTAAQGKAGSPAARAMREPSEARLASLGSVRRRVACRGAGLRRWLSTADAPRSRCRQAACIALCPPSSPAPHPRPPSPSLGLKRNASLFSAPAGGCWGERSHPELVKLRGAWRRCLLRDAGAAGPGGPGGSGTFSPDPERLGKWAGPRRPGKFWLSRGLGATGEPACRWAVHPPTHDLGE